MLVPLLMYAVLLRNISIYIGGGIYVCVLSSLLVFALKAERVYEREMKAPATN